jgi:hypothetical protein
MAGLPAALKEEVDELIVPRLDLFPDLRGSMACQDRAPSELPAILRTGGEERRIGWRGGEDRPRKQPRHQQPRIHFRTADRAAYNFPVRGRKDPFHGEAARDEGRETWGMEQQPDLLFGKIALDRGFLSTEQLESLLEEQEKNGPHPVPLGELCRRKGLLTAKQIRKILEEQRQAQIREEQKTFGALVVKNSFATPEELQKALDNQKDPAGGRLGEILIEMGALTEQERRAVLAMQERLRNGLRREEFEFETREIPIAGRADDSAAGEPGAWLIQESGEGTGQLFHLRDKAQLGRTAIHDVAIADMAASRDHATIERTPAGGYLLRDLDSRNGTFVNGAQLIRPRELRSGDRVRIGDTLLRYVVGAPLPDGSPPPRSLLRRLRDVFDRAWPGLHPQRKAFAAAAILGSLTTLLPWTVQADQPWRIGLASLWGWLVLLSFEAAFVAVLFRSRAAPLDLRTFAVAAGAFLLAGAVSFGRLVALALIPEKGAGFGLPLAVLAGVVPPAVVWFRGRAAPAAARTEGGWWDRLRGTALRAGESTIRIFRDVSGRRDRSVAIDRREALLEKIGGAAVDAKAAVDGIEGAQKARAAVAAAKDRYEKAGRETSPRDLLIAKSDLAWAESRLRKSLRRLGRLAVDRQVRLEQEIETIAEVKALDAELDGPARRGA